MVPRRSPNPFRVISGTSAGAISSAVLASQARVFSHAVSDLERVWATSVPSMSSSAIPGRCSRAACTGRRPGVWRTRRSQPRSLLDNSPLRELLSRAINLNSIQESIDRGYLDAVTVTAAGYGSARSVSFYQGRPNHEPWDRVRRVGRPAETHARSPHGEHCRADDVSAGDDPARVLRRRRHAPGDAACARPCIWGPIGCSSSACATRKSIRRRDRMTRSRIRASAASRATCSTRCSWMACPRTWSGSRGSTDPGASARAGCWTPAVQRFAISTRSSCCRAATSARSRCGTCTRCRARCGS